MSPLLQVIGVIYRQFFVLESKTSAENIDVSAYHSNLYADIEGA